jgi:hypothetical protein
VRKSATVRFELATPTNEDFCIRLAADVLVSVITDLRRRLEHFGTPRSIAQVLLAEAHVAEAVGLLRTIEPTPSIRESALQGGSLSPPSHVGNRVQRAVPLHQPHRVAV